METFKTTKGTELPLLSLKGKLYLQVMHRLVWFREDHPQSPIETEVVHHSDAYSVVRAYVRDKDGRVIASGTKREDAKHFPDHLEKAETGAIGRALAHVGYGTQFAAEMEEGDGIVDSPAPGPTARSNSAMDAAKAKASPPAGDLPECPSCKTADTVMHSKFQKGEFYCRKCKHGWT